MTEQQIRDRVTGALIGLARATAGLEHEVTDETRALIREALCRPATEETLTRLTAAKRALVPDCFECKSPCGRTADADMEALRADEGKDVAAAKMLLIGAVRALAAAEPDEETDRFFLKALQAAGDGFEAEYILPVALEAGRRIAEKGMC